MNFAGLKRRVLGGMGDTNNALISNSLLLDWANDGQNQIARATECLQDDDEISVVAGLNQYDIDHLDVIRVITAEFDEIVLLPTTREEVSASPFQWGGGDLSTPQAFYVWANKVWITPTPVADGALHIWYYRLPSALVADEDVSEVPLHLHEDIVKYMKAKAKELNEEEDEGRSLMADFELSMTNAREEINHPINDSYPAIRILAGDE